LQKYNKIILSGFQDNFFWRIERDGKKYPKYPMGRFWTDFPEDVTVDAVYARGENIFIFSGKKDRFGSFLLTFF